MYKTTLSKHTTVKRECGHALGSALLHDIELETRLKVEESEKPKKKKEPM